MLYKVLDGGLVKNCSPVLEVYGIPRVATQSWSTEIDPCKCCQLNG